MIPTVAREEFAFEELSEQPTKTYALDFESSRARGFTDGLKAMEQAVFLILSTERFRHMIYSWNYGVELDGILGSDRALAESELKRVITEALLQDERITAVSDFAFDDSKRGELRVSFTVATVFGAIDTGLEVNV